MSAGLYPVAPELEQVSFTSGPIDLLVPADEVWSVVGDFFDLTWLDPSICCEPLEEDRRRVGVGQGSVVNALLDRGTRSYEYSLVSSSLPVTEYKAKLEVTPHEVGRCLFEWHGVACTSGPVDEARAALEPVYQAVGQVLQARFNTRAQNSSISLDLTSSSEHSNGGSFFKVRSNS